jgi:drug/metabolite transporter (DMT)-like permease
MSNATTAKLLLLALSVCWGLSWAAMRIALDEVSPWTLRVLGYSIGAVTLLALMRAQGRALAIPYGRAWLHVGAAAAFNVIAFGLAGTFAQLLASTSRVIIINYSMPIWGSLMAFFVLGERIGARSAIGLVLCITGLTVLVYPVLGEQLNEPIGLLLAFICSLSWGAGTIYMKWARIQGDLMAITFWQVVLGVIAFAIGFLVFQGAPTFEPLQWRTWGGLLYTGIFGTGLAFFIWFNIIGRLSTSTASLGALLNPVVGVIGAVILLGDRPTVSDITGFALIFSAAACVLIPERRKPLRPA